MRILELPVNKIKFSLLTDLLTSAGMWVAQTGRDEPSVCKEIRVGGRSGETR